VVLQQALFDRQARRWAQWWNANSKTLTQEPAYQTIELSAAQIPAPSPAKDLGPGAKLGEGSSGGVISPSVEKGSHFLDLDTGYQPKWPDDVPREPEKINERRLAAWAAENGVDLMCIIHRDGDVETYVLRTFDAKTIELAAGDDAPITQSLATGKLLVGRTVGELLMHYDAAADRHVPDVEGWFLVRTREGNRFLVKTVDRVTQIKDLTGQMGGWPKGIGFQKGVRIDYRAVLP
jgi:hypothetical protein